MILNKYSRLFLRILGVMFITGHFFLYDRLTVLTDDQMWEIVRKNMADQSLDSKEWPILLSAEHSKQYVGSIFYKYEFKKRGGYKYVQEIEIDRKWHYESFAVYNE